MLYSKKIADLTPGLSSSKAFSAIWPPTSGSTHCLVEQRKLLWCQVPQVHKSDTVYNHSCTFILEMPPQKPNPKGTCTETFMAAIVINSKVGHGPRTQRLAQQGQCSPEKASPWATSTRRRKTQEHVTWKERTKHRAGAWLPTRLTCTQRLEGQTDHEREGKKSQTFIRAGLLKLECASKLCGHFIRMQILTQEVWEGMRFCILKGRPGGSRWAMTTV